MAPAPRPAPATLGLLVALCARGCASLGTRASPEAARKDDLEGAPYAGALALRAQSGSVSALVFDPGACKVCAFNDENAPRLYIDGREDGLGNNVEAILYGMAFAAKTGMNFGGVINGGKMAHGVPVSKIVADMFGLNREQLYLKAVPRPAITAKHLAQLEAISEDRNRGVADSPADVWLQTNLPQNGIKSPRPIDEFLDERFLGALRAQVLPHLVAEHPIADIRSGTGPVVAMHVRRGDVSRTLNKDRYTKDEFYYDLADRIRSQLPGAEVHVWSELAGTSRSEDFDGFRERNITVHLDTDIVETWAHMAQAQVLVMAKSSFSFISAILNAGCVVYQPWLTRPLRNFTTADPKQGLSDEDIASCLARIATSK